MVRQDGFPSPPIRYFLSEKCVFIEMRGKCGSAGKCEEMRRSDLGDWWQSSSFSCHSVGAELCGPADLSTRPCDFCLCGISDFSVTLFIFVANRVKDLCLCEIVRVSGNLAASHASLHPSQLASSSSVCCYLSP